MTDSSVDPVEGVGSAADRLASEIRRLRTGAGLSQARLATMVGYTPAYVSLAERARKGLPSSNLIRAIDGALNADGALLALHAEAESEQQAVRHLAVDGEGQPGQHQRRDAAVMAVVAGDTNGEATWPKSQAVALVDEGISEHLVDMAADESSQFLAWAEDENVGELTLDQLHTQIRRISQAYLKSPTAPLFTRTKEVRDRAFTLLAGQQRPSHTRDLYAAAGWSLIMLSWMSVDFGRPEAGEDHARAAWLCAERAEHDGLRGWVRAAQHKVAYWRDDFDQAGTYATDGLRHATGSAALFLASFYANDLARNGQRDQAWEALRYAWEIAESSDQAGDELAGPFTCAIGRAQSCWADTQLILGAADAALEYADRAVAATRLVQGSGHMVHVDKARAHIALGQLDGAEQALAPVLAIGPEYRVRPLIARMNDVQAALATSPHATDPIADRMRSELQAFQNDATSRELPSD